MGKKVNILFISPEFYQYINAITDELKRNDVEVTYFKWWPSLGVFKKYYFKKNAKYRNRLMQKYLEKILAETNGVVFDMVFLCSTIYFTREQTKQLLDAFPTAKHVFFMWDTIVNYPVTETYLDLFDEFYSFDKTDCEKYSLKYHPTFADPSVLELEKANLESQQKDLDLFFLGSVDGYRYKLIKEVESYCLNNNISFKAYMYFKSKLLFHLAKLLYREMRHAKKSEFVFTPIKGKEKEELYSHSRAILEIVRERQNGMSMRSIESQMVNIKMVTNQDTIKLYNLYNPNNVCVISENDCSGINREFLDSKIASVSEDVKNQYKVSTFVKDLFLDNLK